MFRLLIIADDFTGALDTGVQFSKAGIVTMVTSDTDVDFLSVPEEVEVLSVDTETRHLTRKQAYETVWQLSRRAREAGARYIYKKVDSCLRGNLGAELEGLLDGSQEKTIALIPAFPKTGRTTRAGIQYYKGTAIHESEFAKDPINPIGESRISRIIASQSGIRTWQIARDSYGQIPERVKQEEGVVICDAQTDADLLEICNRLCASGAVRVVAGSGGFAEMMAQVFPLKAGRRGKTVLRSADKTLYVSGSIHAVSMSQIRRAVEKGMSVLVMNPAQTISGTEQAWEKDKQLCDQVIRQLETEGKLAIVSAADKSQIVDVASLADRFSLNSSEMVLRLTNSMGWLAASAAAGAYPCNIVVFGGDTLFQIMKQIDCAALLPQEEVVPGVVVSLLQARDGRSYLMVSKAGSFGEEYVINEIEEYLHCHK